jgi:hypothetical protein
MPAENSSGSLKACSKCARLLPPSSFHRRGHYTRTGTRSACRECTAADVKQKRDAEEREPTDEEAKKSAVRSRTRRAVDQGILAIGPCEQCGAAEVEAHHESYDGPEAHLHVNWLCKRHHALHHGERPWTKQLDLKL